eukprot:TRINITY_DN7112_c0_g1_i1.p1 TRINITY_DN7112_c0_g1~~TRINITY_DN7112_c0_g1_i1.p1  ORF type:complete len:286 (-),score=66.00 TRINITY_DN7112_c0_g1_i1:140-997(-)
MQKSLLTLTQKVAMLPASDALKPLIQSGAVDFGRVSRDYANLRPGFPDSFYNRIATLLPTKTLAGARALDVGCGAGQVALALAGRGAQVTGTDVASQQVEAAAAKARELGLHSSCTFAVAPAEQSGLPDGSFDLITAGQCWHWFDVPAVLAEVRRLLRPGGTLVIGHFCYLPMRSALAADTEALVLKFNPAWTMAGFDGLYPHQVNQVVAGGLEFVEQFSYDFDQAFTHESWRGRMRTCNGVGAGTLSDAEVSEFDRQLQDLLDLKYPEPLHVWHRVWAVVARQQ